MPDAGASPLLDVAIARKAHGRRAARVDVIEDLRFTLVRGTVTCLLGPSGCGKTSALRIALGLDTDFDGMVSPPANTLRLGVVFQDPRLLPWRTVAENVALAAPGLAEVDITALLTELGLDAWRDHRPNQLSLGMARRVALARALAVRPDLLVLDEAFVSLDERAAAAMRASVFAAVVRRQSTVLMVTHNIDEALTFSDTLLVLAPRPTRVVETFVFDTPLDARNDAWRDEQRRRLVGSGELFLQHSGQPGPA